MRGCYSDCNLNHHIMRIKCIVGAMTMVFGVLTYFTTSKPISQIAMWQLNDVESVAACEVCDGCILDGHCVSNDRNDYFCSYGGFHKDCCISW